MEGFNNYDNTKAYKTIETLVKKIAENPATCDLKRYLIVKVPHGKNENKFTAIFHLNNGEGMPAVHAGFKVMG